MAEPRADLDMADVSRLYEDIGAALAAIRQLVAREIPDPGHAEVVQEDATSFLARRLAEPAAPVPLAPRLPPEPAPHAAAPEPEVEAPQPIIVQSVLAPATFAWPAWSAAPAGQPQPPATASNLKPQPPVTETMVQPEPPAAEAVPLPKNVPPDPFPVPIEIAACGPLLPDASLRDTLREMIREELHGELGARFSANLRAVIRREIVQALDDRMLHG